MGYITWTDSVGFATLSNTKPKLGRRFAGYVPDVDRIVDRKTALGTGVFYEFMYRQDYTAKFQIDKIPVTQTDTMLRFKEFAMQGCSFTMYTEDESDRFYEVRIKPGTEIQFELSDRQMLEYSLSLEVMSAATVPVRLLCHYRE